MQPDAQDSCVDWTTLPPESIQQVVLNRLRYSVGRYLDLHNLREFTEARVIIDKCTKELCMSLRLNILGRELDQFQYSKTWWDAVKQRWFPNWAKKRWPVQHTVIKLMEVYPGIQARPGYHREIIKGLDALPFFEAVKP